MDSRSNLPVIYARGNQFKGGRGGGGNQFKEEEHPRDQKGEFSNKGGKAGEAKPAGGTGSGTADASGRKATAKVDANPQARAAINEVIGRELDDQDIQEMLGAPSGAQIAADALPGGVVSFHVTHPLYQQFHLSYLVPLGGDRKILRLELFHLRDSAPKGMGTKFWDQTVTKGRELGLEAVFIPDAARNENRGMVGYAVWPKFGCDGDLPDNIKAKLPPSLAHATTLLDLQETAEGSKWWEANGDTISCAFELDRNSDSSKAWERYRQRKGLK